MAERGRLFEQYKLTDVRLKSEKELGHGSYAAVLELEYMGLKCAGKRIHDILLAQDGPQNYTIRRFEEECDILSQLRHPNIIQFLGVYFQHGARVPMLVMEFLPANLTSCIKMYGIMPNEVNFSILYDVSLGLNYLHGQTPPICHRDLSSNNVLLTPNMTAKISDLGMARMFHLTPLQVSHLTQIPGTPAYMPPEVMMANPNYDTSIDVFSYGILIIHMFSGRWPEPQVGPNRIEDGKLIPVTEAERRQPFLNVCGSDHALMPLILKCIENDPLQRGRLEEIVQQMKKMVSMFPASYSNRVEMLRRIEAADATIAQMWRDHPPSSITWKTCCKLPVSMNSGQATLIDGKVYYGGGLTTTELEGNIADNLVYCYDPIQNSWNSLPPLEVKHFGLGQINHELVATGGVSKSSRQIQNIVYTFDNETRQWRAVIPSMLTARCFHGVLSLQTALIVAAGEVQSSNPSQCNSYTDSVEVYKPQERMWYLIKPLPVQFFNMSTAILHDKCYIAGGFRDDPGALCHVYCATIEDLFKNTTPRYNSTQVEDSHQSVWKNLPNTPSYQPSVCMLAGKMFAFGGASEPRGEQQRGIWVHSSDSETWEHFDDLPNVLRLCTVIKVSPFEVMVIGGLTQSADYVNTVFIGRLQ